jgi:hypothetical protein
LISSFTAKVSVTCPNSLRRAGVSGAEHGLADLEQMSSQAAVYDVDLGGVVDPARQRAAERLTSRKSPCCRAAHPGKAATMVMMWARLVRDWPALGSVAYCVESVSG